MHNTSNPPNYRQFSLHPTSQHDNSTDHMLLLGTTYCKERHNSRLDQLIFNSSTPASVNIDYTSQEERGTSFLCYTSIICRTTTSTLSPRGGVGVAVAPINQCSWGDNLRFIKAAMTGTTAVPGISRAPTSTREATTPATTMTTSKHSKHCRLTSRHHARVQLKRRPSRRTFKNKSIEPLAPHSRSQVPSFR